MPVKITLPTSREDWAKLGKFTWTSIIIPFGTVIIGIVIFRPLERWWEGPEKYVIYLVGDRNDSEAQKIFTSVLSQVALTKPRFDGRDIEVVQEDDKADFNLAVSKAKEISLDPRTLLVVGHVSGDRTIRTLPEYMRAEPKILVITTRESTPKLLEQIQFCEQGNLYCPLIPLSPTDDVQAANIVTFAQQNGRKKLLILAEKDETHQSYTDYLSGELADLIRHHQTNLEYVSTEAITGTVSFDNALSVLDREKPDCLIFVGTAQTLLNFSDRLADHLDAQKVAPADRPMLIASDGAVSEMLWQTPTKGYPLYVTHQLSSDQYKEGSTRHVYGVDAVAIINQLIEEVGEKPKFDEFRELGFLPSIRHIINMHRVTDARMLLTKKMEEHGNGAGFYTGLNGRRYEYHDRYTRFEGYFHVWHIEGRQVAEADEHDSTR
jgi:hypothetical protein